ncbi:hypothetical protein PRZ48_011399 [Zasmidium cellare]|uniref:Uncharacterized protein n=1 Tax=Zasmidium cellare TaxID=395010 RepID=A0ABR0E6F9_ZASCE|nr:hypothetical protein PRZ48_011399 [Zasmidium cellare]
MRNLWALLLRTSGFTSSLSTAPTSSTNFQDVTPSNTSLLEEASTIAHSTVSDIIEQRVPRSLSPSSSWQFVTRPQIKHAETSAVIKGPGNQQAIVLAESTPTSECVPSTAYAELVTCMPAVDAGHVKSTVACKTSYSETSGCDLDPSPSTTSLTSTLTLQCSQASCGQGGCAGGKTKTAKHTGTKCKDCTTSEGLVYAPQSTVPATASDPVAGATPSLAPEEGGSLTKRTLLEPKDFNDNYDQFMLTEVDKAREEGNIVEHREPDTGGRSSSSVWTFFEEAENFAVEELSGCTVIILVSRRGVWMSHHWEDPTFINLHGLPSTVQQDILVGMFTGDNSGMYPGLNQFTQPGYLFDNGVYGRTRNRVQPIIYTPYSTAFQEQFGAQWPPYKYLPDILQIQRLLLDAYRVSVPVYTYVPLELSEDEKEEVFDTTARGKILVQYDPQNWLMTERRREGDNDEVCYQQEAVVRIWDDSGHKLYEDRFFAMPEQNVLVQMQQFGKRSEETQIDWSQPYCGLPNTTESECKITSAPATTISAHTVGTSTVAAQTISANTYCQCGETIAGVETSTAQDGSRSVYCNNGGPSASHTKPAMTLPPASTCYVTSAPATTLPDKTVGSSVRHGETIPANTYCQCGKTVAGVLNSTGIDGGETFYCANGGAASTSPVTRSPPPTACKLTSAPATTWGSQTFPAETYCQCGDRIAGLDTSEGDDGGKTVFCADGEGTKTSPIPITTATPSCEIKDSSCSCGKATGSVHSVSGNDGKKTYDCVVGSKTWPAVSTSTPEPPKKSDTCRLHLKEDTNGISTGGWQFSHHSNIELFVNEASRWNYTLTGPLINTHALRASDTKLEKDFFVNFGMTTDHDDVPEAVNRRAQPPRPGHTTKFTKWFVFVGYGAPGNWQSHLYAPNNDTGQVQPPETWIYPYCRIGGWDIGGADIFGLQLDPTRDLDCYFKCAPGAED